MTQLSNDNHSKASWISQAKQDFDDFEISSIISDLEGKSENAFKKEVKSKARDYLFQSLKEKQKKHSKMKNLIYDEFKIQDYFVRNDISTEFKKTLLMWRTRMAKFGEKFRGGQNTIICPVCLEHEDSQEKSFNCPGLKEKFEIYNCQYSDIFNPSDANLPSLIKSLMKITQTREDLKQA